jgi:hypothetical protein
MDNLIYLKDILKKRKYSLLKINDIINDLNYKKKIINQVGGNGEDIKWNKLIDGYRVVVEKFKTLDNSDFKDLVKIISEIINIYDEKK